MPGYACGPVAADRLDDFAALGRDLVARYSAPPYNVRYWELWNEPDVAPSQVAPSQVTPDSSIGCWGDQTDPYYGGGCYAQMLEQVYAEIKAADPQAQVLVGGLLLDCNPNNPPPCENYQAARFFEGILRSNGAAYFDGVSFHAYDYYDGAIGQYSNGNWQSAWDSTGPSTHAKAAFLRRAPAAQGVSDKYLLNTEAAVLCYIVCDATYETTKAYYVARAYAMAIAENLQANVWYSVFGW